MKVCPWTSILRSRHAGRSTVFVPGTLAQVFAGSYDFCHTHEGMLPDYIRMSADSNLRSLRKCDKSHRVFVIAQIASKHSSLADGELRGETHECEHSQDRTRSGR